MESPSSGTPRTDGALALAVVINVAGLLMGVAAHSVTVSFGDTGRILAPLLVALGLLVGEIVAFRYRSWGGVLMLPVFIALGVFASGDV